MNILATGAHFDDVELGCSGSLLAWKAQGHSITLFVATHSGYADAKGNIIRSKEIAREEGLRAAGLLGAECIEGGLPTLELEFGETLNCKILDALDRVKPDLVLTHWPNDVQHDHQALSLSTIQCSRHVRCVATYCSNWYPSVDQFDPRLFVDITPFMERKLELIKAHASENDRTNGRWLDFARSTAKLAGLKAQVDYAEEFEVIKWRL